MIARRVRHKDKKIRPTLIFLLIRGGYRPFFSFNSPLQWVFDVSFTKEIAVGAGAEEDEHEDVLPALVLEQPVSFYKTFLGTSQFPLKRVRSTTRG